MKIIIKVGDIEKNTGITLNECILTEAQRRGMISDLHDKIDISLIIPAGPASRTIA